MRRGGKKVRANRTFKDSDRQDTVLVKFFFFGFLAFQEIMY